MPLPNEATVLRGGTVTGAQLFNGCAEHRSHPGIHGFSVQSYPEKSVVELASAGQFPHGKISVTTVGAIRAAGYDVVETQGRGYHATVVVADTWTEADADALAKNFAVQSNPAQRS